MGSEAMEVKRELSHYERLREVSPINVRVRDYLRDGSEDFLWQGFHHFYQNLAAFLQVPAVWITTYQNTTKAIRHALQLCVTDFTHIVATDLEFGSVLETIIDIAPEDRITIVKVRDDHLAERLDYREIVDNLAERLNSLASSAASETRFVVVLSHVTYLTGAVLDLTRFRQKLTIDPSRLVLIIDGAQAAGNIQVGRSFLESCDFYASSGHKWLLGKTTLGILVHEPENIYRKLNIDLETIRGGTAPFSHIDYDMKDYTGETVDIEQIVSLNAMLVEFNSMGQERVAQHNRDLAREFSNLVTRIRGVFVVSSPIQSGIVSIRLKHARVIGDTLERCYDYIGQALDPDILRFSFHYYMNQRDVYCLVDALNDVTKRQLTK
jgi:selenocysteine lyase/cysteine desulfurase